MSVVNNNFNLRFGNCTKSQISLTVHETYSGLKNEHDLYTVPNSPACPKKPRFPVHLTFNGSFKFSSVQFQHLQTTTPRVTFKDKINWTLNQKLLDHCTSYIEHSHKLVMQPISLSSYLSTSTQFFLVAMLSIKDDIRQERKSFSPLN